MATTKYWMTYTESTGKSMIPLHAKTDNGARRCAKSIAKQEGINYWDILFTAADGYQGRLCNDAKRWA